MLIFTLSKEQRHVDDGADQMQRQQRFDVACLVLRLNLQSLKSLVLQAMGVTRTTDAHMHLWRNLACSCAKIHTQAGKPS